MKKEECPKEYFEHMVDVVRSVFAAEDAIRMNGVFIPESIKMKFAQWYCEKVAEKLISRTSAEELTINISHMKIKERAKKYTISISPYPQDKGATWDTDTEKGYIAGATDQREIDIEKAIECTCRICNPQCMPEFKKCDFDKNKCRKIALLRKAMMEE